MFAGMFSSMLKMGMWDYVDQETTYDDVTLVGKNGTLTTFVRLNGSFTTVGAQKFAENLYSIVDKLKGNLAKPGYKIDFVFTSDPTRSAEVVEESMASTYRTAETLGMNILPMLQERAKLLEGKTCFELGLMVITTYPSVLATDVERKNAMSDRVDAIKDNKVGLKPGQHGQSPFLLIRQLVDSHKGFVANVTHTLKELISVDILTVQEGLFEAKKSIKEDMVGRNWKPAVPGTRVPVRIMKESKNKGDCSHVMYPDLAFQLFNQAPQVASENETLVKLGDRYIAPLLVDIPPQTPTPFSELFRALGERTFPWRMCFSITTGHDGILSRIGNKKTFASFLAFTSSENKAIKEAAEGLIELAKGGDVLVGCNLSFATWGSDIREVTRRKALLTQAVQGWGYCDVIEERGDAIEAWMETLPGLMLKPISTQFPLPVEEAFRMAPISRPASPWASGNVIFRTFDKRAFPFLAGSSLQTTWVDLIYALPGAGKSFYLAVANMGLILAPGNKSIPRIACLDIGFSSSAWVQFVKDSLPENKKHLAEAFKLEMTHRHAINPFDTPLGCRRPLAIDREFLVNMMTLLLTPAGRDNPIERLPEICSALIDAMYDYFSDDRSPRAYERGLEPRVDEALDQYGVSLSANPTWWEVVDKLALDHALYTEAILAQRFAVPLVADATMVLNNDATIKDLYGGAQMNGESMISFVTTMIVSATKDYPILSQPTQFDTGSARIVAIDLQNVAKSGSAAADKKTGVMYMLARQVLCREFYRDSDSLMEMLPAYRPYHQRQLDEDALTPKKLCMDEYHRTQKARQVRAQAIIDVREGRKFNVHVAILSQSLMDFDPELVEFATNIYVMSKGGTEDSIRQIVERFRPSSDAIVDLRRYVTGPSAEGSTLLYLGTVKGDGGGRVQHALRLTLGPMEVWAYSTTHEDVNLRRKLVQQVGLGNALKVLAAAFPGGSAKSEFERRRKAASQDDEDDNLFNVVATELLDKYRHLIVN